MSFDEGSHEAPRDVLGEIRDGRFHEFAVSDRELSHSEEPSAKKSKLSDVDLDLDSSEGCVEVPSLKGEEDKGNCEGNLVSEAEKASDCSAKILETVVGNSSEEMNVFDVYRVFLEMNNEKEKNLDNLDLLEVAEACGVTFPRPRWWPENFDP
ncbi:uncharacterized protein HKW66_Vig0038160 [Vigna angularis]|uniref:Uncharacterized protein n=2 Tax=Phaseolus angularis TaxID=3914 RepID=A0A8T0LAI6_PHAAN|nr:uncharacterized protein HKW66_Vig0038160 [Vigna angularis]BAT75176.1 hypothetical protein VIGAN_01299800 [Vigna angularis var. angularis]